MDLQDWNTLVSDTAISQTEFIGTDLPCGGLQARGFGTFLPSDSMCAGCAYVTACIQRKLGIGAAVVQDEKQTKARKARKQEQSANPFKLYDKGYLAMQYVLDYIKASRKRSVYFVGGLDFFGGDAELHIDWQDAVLALRNAPCGTVCFAYCVMFGITYTSEIGTIEPKKVKAFIKALEAGEQVVTHSPE